jgi:hypothetical protein
MTFVILTRVMVQNHQIFVTTQKEQRGGRVV